MRGEESLEGAEATLMTVIYDEDGDELCRLAGSLGSACWGDPAAAEELIRLHAAAFERGARSGRAILQYEICRLLGAEGRS